ncbi:hypothetical protein [Zobellia sp. 1_MG-2023]|uniref:hypothetical protein n=1 Tax=Zobellia sp. 1_MG-2023 TaxID=3062626 RepID=UPI0026E17126|nr:hypothetical protein [Zobellia sp. 1_MG-2023]MDO6819459.1 hypothetical protein [Zobellia sp. 1_MG-2023]
MNRKEIFWLFGTAVLVLVLTLILFGIDALNIDSTFDINIHDTYFVIANVHLVLLLFVFIFFKVYLIRVVLNGFKNLTANLVLIIATLLIAVVLGKIIGMLDFFSGPPNNDSMADGANEVGNALKIISRILFTVQMILLVLLAYFGFKTGRNYNTEKKH